MTYAKFCDNRFNFALLHRNSWLPLQQCKHYHATLWSCYNFTEKKGKYHPRGTTNSPGFSSWTNSVLTTSTPLTHFSSGNNINYIHKLSSANRRALLWLLPPNAGYVHWQSRLLGLLQLSASGNAVTTVLGQCHCSTDVLSQNFRTHNATPQSASLVLVKVPASFIYLLVGGMA